MTEYRVVSTLDTEHVYNGEKYHYEVNSGLWWGGIVHKCQTFDKNKAEHFLMRAKQECPKFDKRTQENTGHYVIRYWQTNIRIQSREVTEWK